MISYGSIACFVKMLFAKYLYAYCFAFKPSRQFRILWVVFGLIFALLFSVPQLIQDDKINFRCMQCLFCTFVQPGFACFVWCQWNILCLTCEDLSDVLPTVSWCCMLSLLNDVCFAVLPSTVSFSLLISLFYLFLPPFLVVIKLPFPLGNSSCLSLVINCCTLDQRAEDWSVI